MAVSPLELRQALGHFVTGVTVVTTRGHDGAPQGITANSFTSVSLDPPLVSVNLSRNLASFPHFRNCATFAVHILGDQQQDISARFAHRGSDKWAGLPSLETGGGVPLLRDRLGLFVCSFYAAHEAGDHEILVGKVEEMDVTPNMYPLAFFKGSYRSISENAAMAV